MKVAMIEDDIELSEILSEFLNKHNIKVKNFEDPYIALSSLKIENFDALILDLTLPDMDGLEILKKIREFSDIPIIISSARSDLTDKIIGLELGADDYLPKPYNPRELEARLKAITRRREKKSQKDFFIDKDSNEIKLKGKILQLTPAEYEILSYLIEHPNRAVSREELIKNIDLINPNSSEKSIDVIIGRIRQKIEDDPKNPKYIRSVRGVGYKFVN
ncbi:response regulator transcription factor [Nitrosophilus kaiyonis]|uniref:response regulator transcription factor n=1 Tax=Nitrosophilus kaiyonis TaxID=2930200 RepID=UPI00248FB32D|nr:response regulator transcription factor [Nitrosophilus kaiyonis]